MSDIVFRRIRGRIVPIKKKKTHEGVKAGASIAGGIGVAAISARSFAKIKMSAERAHQMAFDFQEGKSKKLPKGITTASQGFKKAKIRFGLSKSYKIGGQILGGALISAGVRKVLIGQGYDDTLALDLGAEAGSQTAAAVIAQQSKRTFGVKAKFKIPGTVKRLAKDIATKFIKRQLRFKF